MIERLRKVRKKVRSLREGNKERNLEIPFLESSGFPGLLLLQYSEGPSPQFS